MNCSIYCHKRKSTPRTFEDWIQMKNFEQKLQLEKLKLEEEAEKRKVEERSVQLLF